MKKDTVKIWFLLILGNWNLKNTIESELEILLLLLWLLSLESSSIVCKLELISLLIL